MFSTPTADLSRSSSRNSFRKPGESAPTTPGAGPATGANAMSAFKGRVDELKGATREVRSGVQSPKSSTPIPTVMAPVLPPKQGKKKAVLSTSELNKLQAKALRAKLMGGEDADRLQAEYDEAVRAAAGGGSGDENDQEETRVEALPSMDGHGRLYDVGTGKGDPGPILPGNRRKNQDKVGLVFSARSPHAHFSSLRLGTLKPENSYVSMPMTIPRLSRTCSAKNVLVGVRQTKRTLTLRLRGRLPGMESTRMTWNMSMTTRSVSQDGR